MADPAMRSSVAVSAPGKVLLAGGYLVLDRQHTGLVFGLSARIHVIVQARPPGNHWSGIRVRSPQFKNAEWNYYCETPGDVEGFIVIPYGQTAYRNQNAFVDFALKFSIGYLSVTRNLDRHPIMVTILADSDYYSPPDDKPPIAEYGRFMDYDVPLNLMRKTGLGSSAALVTAIAGALLLYYSDQRSSNYFDEVGRTRLHNLAQAIHAAAQDQVGSGFDVAAAVYGSCLYRRYTASVVERVVRPSPLRIPSRITEVVKDEELSWDAGIDKKAAQLPRRIRLLLCDVHGGTKSVGMARSVLAWRSHVAGDANYIWGKLQEHNDQLVKLLRTVTDMASTNAHEYDQQLETIVTSAPGELPPTIWEGKYQDIRDTITNIRTYLRRMGRRVNVPIEPAPQTELLDACSAVPGILGGVVPGAGGYDAIVLLAVDDERVQQKVQALCENWKGTNEGANEKAPTKVQVLGVREDNTGVRVEQVDDYIGWLL